MCGKIGIVEAWPKLPVCSCSRFALHTTPVCIIKLLFTKRSRLPVRSDFRRSSV